MLEMIHLQTENFQILFIKIHGSKIHSANKKIQ